MEMGMGVRATQEEQTPEPRLGRAKPKIPTRGNWAVGIWTEEKIEHLIKLFHEGQLCTREIAVELGSDFTRNAIIGKLNRLSLRRELPGIHPRGHRVHKQISGNPFHGKPKPKLKIVPAGPGNAMRVYKAERIEFKQRAANIVPLNVESYDLFKTCAHPFGDGPFTFCGHSVRAGSTYCAPHHALNWMPVGSREA